MVALRAKAQRRMLFALIVGILLLGAAALGLRSALRNSLPAIDGEIRVAGISANITIKRDAQGVPTISGETRDDVAFGLGFVHGQDRFFQMDGLRRYAAGELSELLGPGPDGECLAWDWRVRVQRFR